MVIFTFRIAQFGELVTFDNIGVLEETIDGKNTFHSTQIVMWQHGPPAPREYTSYKLERDRVLNQEFLQRCMS